MDAKLNDLKLELWLRQRERGAINWRTKEGKEIPIKEMTDTHLLNTINLLEDLEDRRDGYYDALSSFEEKYI